MGETCSSGEDPLIKTRKPYTITKQRERWTDHEHNSFLQALKLHGRSWHLIQQHIGTKSAVQIRSHAQKFFSKLEKEAVVKGVPLGQSIDIEIPPPRPKRRPSNPYPRKMGVGKDTKIATPVDLEKEAPPDPQRVDAMEKPEEKVFTLSHEAPCTSTCSATKTSIWTLSNPATYREFVPSVKEVAETNESFITIGPKENQKLDKLSVDISLCSHDQLVPGGTTDELGQPNIFCVLPRHVPVHILDGSLGTPSPESLFRPQVGEKGVASSCHNLFTSPIASTITENHSHKSRTSSHQSRPSCFMPISHPPFLHNSPAFFDLIVYSLKQNPDAYAAACYAATIWPGTNMDGCTDVPSNPDDAAIVAATLAAAISWWITKGPAPSYVPLYTTAPTAATAAAGAAAATQSTEDGKAPAMNKDPPLPQENQQLNAEGVSEDLQEQHSPSNSEESGVPNLNNVDHEKKVMEATDLPDLNKTKPPRKKLDRSSCGSNTPSSSEVDSYALDNHEKGDTEETKEADVGHVSSDSSTRRTRSNIGNLNDSWKEVSEEGRLAFQALFSREVLPQSFPPPHDLRKQQQQQQQQQQHHVEESTSACKDDEKATRLYLSSSSHTTITTTNNNNYAWATTCSSGLDKNPFSRGSNKNSSSVGEHGLLTVGVGVGVGLAAVAAVGGGGGNIKYKCRRAGFKPYKRCSVEAKESSMIILNSSSGNQVGHNDNHNVPKRIRLDPTLQLH